MPITSDSSSPQSPHHTPRQLSPQPRSKADNAKATCIVVFGELRGWEARFVLRLDADRPQQVPAHIDHGFAHVVVGTQVVYGPVVLDDTDDEGTRTVVVYTGRRIPDWVGTPMPRQHGWRFTDTLPDQTNVSMEEADLLLIDFGDLHVRGWTRTVWLPYIPRPMQRIDLRLGDGEGPTVPVRVLEVGDDLIVDGATTPFVIVSCAQPPQPDLLERFKWAEEEWVEAKQAAWRDLHDNAAVVESHVEILLGHAITTSVHLHPPGHLVDAALPLLPRDVRTAIDFALPDHEVGDAG